MAIFTILSPAIHDHGKYFRFLLSSISLQNLIAFLVKFYFWGRFVPSYVCEAIENGTVSLISSPECLELRYGKAICFCIWYRGKLLASLFLLDAATLLKVITGSITFLVELLGAFCASCCLQTRIIWFPSICILFVSLSCLTVLVKTSSTTWNKSRDRRCPCLVLELRDSSEHFSSFSMILALVSFHKAFH